MHAAHVGCDRRSASSASPDVSTWPTSSATVAWTAHRNPDAARVPPGDSRDGEQDVRGLPEPFLNHWMRPLTVTRTRSRRRIPTEPTPPSRRAPKRPITLVCPWEQSSLTTCKGQRRPDRAGSRRMRRATSVSTASARISSASSNSTVFVRSPSSSTTPISVDKRSARARDRERPARSLPGRECSSIPAGRCNRARGRSSRRAVRGQPRASTSFETPRTPPASWRSAAWPAYTPSRSSTTRTSRRAGSSSTAMPPTMSAGSPRAS